jgi:Dolichyl-phosphate-mannose-protein mannosyltransferase
MLAGLLLLHILVHAPFLSLPPCSIHVWRQCNTLAVARNFLEEDNRILLPRVDRRGDQSGVTGMSFPAYEWTLAQLYRIAGTDNAVHRGFSLAISMLTLIAAAACFRKLTGEDWMGVAGAWVIAWSPEFFYHSINALPDGMAMACGFGALWAGLRWIEKRNYVVQILSIALLTLAGLIKMQYGLFGIFLFGILAQHHLRSEKFRGAQVMTWVVGGTASLACVLAWYRYANALTEASMLTDFVLQIRPVTDVQEALHIVYRNLVSDLPELLLNYANTLLLILGLGVFLAGRNAFKNWMWPLAGACLVQLAWYLLMLEQMKVHQYYLLPFLLISTLLILIAVRTLSDSKWAVLVPILLFAQPILAAARILPARWMKSDLGIPAEFADQNQLLKLQQCIPDPRWVVAGPDRSGCIWLYFLHAKGFTFDETTDLFEADANSPDLDRYRRQGARWLITKRGEIKTEDTTAAHLSLHAECGEFVVYKVGP